MITTVLQCWWFGLLVSLMLINEVVLCQTRLVPILTWVGNRSQINADDNIVI